METTRVSTKGQVILPKSIRDAYSWKPGTELVVQETLEGVLLRPKRPFPEKTVAEVMGCLAYQGPRKNEADFKEGIARKIRERHGRGRY